MSLFKQLERLYRPDRFEREDFHTEIVAQVLRNAPELTLEWLRSLGVTDLKQANHITVTTQAKFGKLAGQDADSRPDVAISLFEGESTELILVESKVGSKQGSTQLQRYAEILDDERKRVLFKRTSLVFITRDYEAPVIPLAVPDRGFIVKATRWFEFYNKLKTHLEKNSDGLAEQLKLFMEENRMSLGNQFRSTDLVAMENFLSAKALMDETLQGEVYEKGQKILGSVSSPASLVRRLRGYKSYDFYYDFKDQFGCLFGYFLPHENPDEQVWIGVQFYTAPRAAAREEVIQAFRGWIKKEGSWTGEHLDEGTEWAVIRKGKTIQSLIGGKDHVRAIKDHLLQLLEEVGEFKKTYPGLPWSAIVPGREMEA